MLLENGADVNAHRQNHGTALQAASHGGHEKIVQMLIDNGAEVNVRGGKYCSALNAAYHKGSYHFSSRVTLPLLSLTPFLHSVTDANPTKILRMDRRS